MTDTHLPEPPRTGRPRLDLFVAIAALTISAVSIFIARDTSRTMERLAHASFWPFLQLGSGNVRDDGVRAITFAMENVGTGPARIHTFELQVDGKPLPHGGHVLTQLLRACCDAELSTALEANGNDFTAIYGAEVSSPVSRRFLAPNASVVAMSWPRTDTNATVWTALDQARQRGRITMSTCYCSVFDECWIARTNEFPPQEVDRCIVEKPRAGARPSG
jgi:hypothetical protein